MNLSLEKPLILPTAKMGFIPEAILAGGAGSWGWSRKIAGQNQESYRDGNWGSLEKGLYYAGGRLAGYPRGPVGSALLHPLSFSQSTSGSDYSFSRMGAPGTWARARTCSYPPWWRQFTRRRFEQDWLWGRLPPFTGRESAFPSTTAELDIFVV